MDLHPRDVVEQFAADHTGELGVIHYYLSWAVPEAIVPWEDRGADPRLLHGNVLAGDVRQLVVLKSSSVLTPPHVAKRPNCGLLFRTADSQQLRARKRPIDPLTGAAAPEVPAAAIDTLFGPDYSLLPYELVILWGIDFKLRALSRASLAAAYNLDDWDKATVYCEIDLPPAQEPPSAGAAARGPQPSEPSDDFEDLLPDEERLGDDPA